jgi:hypothetical protein
MTFINRQQLAEESIEYIFPKPDSSIDDYYEQLEIWEKCVDCFLLGLDSFADNIIKKQ